jgi:hypothetical protein
LIDSGLRFLLAVHSQTYQCGCYTNLVNDEDFFIKSTPEIHEHQEHPSQVEVEVPIKKSQRGSNFIVAEDNRLVEVWISVSMYAVQGNEQKHN